MKNFKDRLNSETFLKDALRSTLLMLADVDIPADVCEVFRLIRSGIPVDKVLEMLTLNQYLSITFYFVEKYKEIIAEKIKKAILVIRKDGIFVEDEFRISGIPIAVLHTHFYGNKTIDGFSDRDLLWIHPLCEEPLKLSDSLTSVEAVEKSKDYIAEKLFDVYKDKAPLILALKNIVEDSDEKSI